MEKSKRRCIELENEEDSKSELQVKGLRRRSIELENEDSKSELQLKGFDDEDRISELPNEILWHMLSYLPTICSVQTTVLSTRWRNLWKCVPILDFDQKDFTDETAAEYFGWPRLGKFINLVVSQHELLSHITKFHLRCCPFGLKSTDYRLFDSWKVTNHTEDISELDISVVADHVFKKLDMELSQTVYIYKTKLVVYLVSKSTSSFSTGYCFPSTLNILTEWMRFISLSLREEDMIITGRVGEETLFFPSRPKLKTLTSHISVDKNERPRPFYLDAPNLEKLVIQCPSDDQDIPNYYFSNNLTSLVEAEIDLPLTMSSIRVRLLLTKISSLEYLSISVPRNLAGSIPDFKNLKQLKLFRLGSLVWLTTFLGKSPNLECLTLDIGHPKMRNTKYIEEWIHEKYVKGTFLRFHLPLIVPDCLSSRLKTIEWSNFMEGKEEMEVVKYLLDCGEVLRRFSISTCTEKAAGKLSQEILMFHKGSKICEVEVEYGGE